MGEGLGERATLGDGGRIEPLVGGDDDTDTEGFGEHEHVAHTGLRVGQRLVAHSEFTDDHLAVERLRPVHRVPSGNDPPAVAGGSGTTGKHVPQEVEGESVLGPRSDVEREERLGPHCVHVAHGVRGGDSTECERVVDDRCEEVHCCHEGAPVRTTPDSSVVTRLYPYPQVGMHTRFKGRQHLRQLGWAELAGSTGAVAEGGKPHGVVHRD